MQKINLAMGSRVEVIQLQLNELIQNLLGLHNLQFDFKEMFLITLI